MTTLLKSYQKIKNILTQSGIEANEAKIEAKLILKSVFGVCENDFIFDKEIYDDKKAQEMALLRAQSKRPIQHIIGQAHFMAEDFWVNENTLIPRDETEILVTKAIEIIRKNTKNWEKNLSTHKPFDLSTYQPKILDIGTGSGCIACTIAKNSDAQVLGVDISPQALMIALENTTALGLNNKALFRKSDLFSGIRADEKFDVIVSNPPYIPPQEKSQIQDEVKFDPELALYTKDELGIEFYEKITQKAPEYLNKGGFLMFEVGINQAPLVEKLMQKSGFKNIEIIKDLAGIERVILGQI